MSRISFFFCVLFAGCAAPGPTIVLPAVPNPTVSGTVREITNANNALNYYAAYLKDEILATDIEADSTLDSIYEFEDALKLMKTNFPNALVGTYISSRDVLVDPKFDIYTPTRAIPSVGWSPTEFLKTVQNEGYSVGDYSQLPARQKLVDGIVAQAFARQKLYGLNLIYTDNWSYFAKGTYPASEDIVPDWSSVEPYMATLQSRLHALGILLGCNIAIVPGDNEANGEVRKVFSGMACDIVTMEEAAPPSVMTDEAGLTSWLADFNAMIAKGTLPVLIPLSDYSTIPGNDIEAKTLAEADFYAGLSVVLQGPMVALSFFYPPQRWHKWYSDLGKPTGEMTRNGFVLSRTFEHGSVVVDTVARTTEFTVQ